MRYDPSLLTIDTLVFMWREWFQWLLRASERNDEQYNAYNYANRGTTDNENERRTKEKTNRIRHTSHLLKRRGDTENRHVQNRSMFNFEGSAPAMNNDSYFFLTNGLHYRTPALAAVKAAL